ncbi:hypothetical protein [Occultella aeris]|uniref:hypothetical protein n=1 Tax=Occultella aeris TaxID=2761496 RepID=UPI0018D3800B|nr:hypothetical protein [Occultella aeris]
MDKERERPSDDGYDADQDPDSDPEQLTSRQIAQQPDQAEGEDDPAKTRGE